MDGFWLKTSQHTHTRERKLTHETAAARRTKRTKWPSRASLPWKRGITVRAHRRFPVLDQRYQIYELTSCLVASLPKNRLWHFKMCLIITINNKIRYFSQMIYEIWPHILLAASVSIWRRGYRWVLRGIKKGQHGNPDKYKQEPPLDGTTGVHDGTERLTRTSHA